MPQLALADLDRAFAEEPYLRFVEERAFLPGGVDPLGLRQLNLDLMDAALPGINNVTTHVRPYAFMSWAWWKAARLAEERGEAWAKAADLQETVDRLEGLFVWSHFLVGKGEGVPGRNVVRDKLPRTGSARDFEFFGPAWDVFRNSRRSSTALMAPIQYGPSVKALKWLIASGPAFTPSTEAMQAVEALDARVAQVVPAEMMRPGKVSVGTSDGAKVYEAWPIDAPTEAERRAFRHLFYDLGARAEPGSPERRRRDTLDLVVSVLGQSDGQLDVERLRRAMASGRLPNGVALQLPDRLVPAQRHWAALQARQLQRIALESLLRWIEIRIDAGRTLSEELAEDAEAAAREHEDGADAPSVGAYLDRAASRAGEEGWPATGGRDGETDILALMRDILDAQREEGCPRVPGLALRGIAYSEAIARSLKASGVGAGPSGPLGGNIDRLPLGAAIQILEAARDRGLKSLWTEIVERWVIGQHVRWSVARNGDGTQRLRIALEERGWARLRNGAPSGPFGPTPDRLATALALSAECGLIQVSRETDTLSYLGAH